MLVVSDSGYGRASLKAGGLELCLESVTNPQLRS